MDIKMAEDKDAAALAEIYRPYVERTTITFEYVAPDAEAFARRIAHTLERYPYLAAWEDGKIAGYAYAGIFKDRAAYARTVETSVYVAQDRKGRGIGGALYRALEDALRVRGILNLTACIAVTDDKNDPYLTNESLHFHEHMGFSPVGRFHRCGYKFDRWYDIVWMEKLL